MNKAAKVVSNIVYGVGAVITAALVGIAIFGSTKAVNPDVMLPMTWKEQAFMWLAFGTVPMLLACMAVYKFNEVRNSTNRKRNFILIFLPGFICSVCALYVIGVIAVGMVNSFLV